MKRSELKVGQAYKIGRGRYAGGDVGIVISTDVYEQPYHYRTITEVPPKAHKVILGEGRRSNRKRGIPVLVAMYPSVDQVQQALAVELPTSFAWDDRIQVDGDRTWRIDFVQAQEIVQTYDEYLVDQAERQEREAKRTAERDAREAKNEALLDQLNLLVPDLKAKSYNHGEVIDFQASALPTLITALIRGPYAS